MTDIDPKEEKSTQEIADEDLEDVAGGMPLEPDPRWGPHGVSPD